MASHLFRLNGVCCVVDQDDGDAVGEHRICCDVSYYSRLLLSASRRGFGQLESIAFLIVCTVVVETVMES